MPIADKFDQLRNQYQEAVVAGEANSANAIIDSALVQGISPNKLYMGVIVPALEQLGETWHAGRLSIAHEQLATQISLNVMARLRQVVRPKISLGLRAVVATINGDRHFLGSQVIADFLTMEGWQVDYLGTHTPNEDIVSFVSDRKPNLVGISVMIPEYIDSLKVLIASVQNLPQSPKILVGGAGLPSTKRELASIGADAYASNAYEAVSEVKKLFGLAGSGVLLFQYLKSLGERIVTYRSKRRLSQQELAGLSGLDRAYISSVENGKQNLTIGAIYKLADALDVSLEDLLTPAG